MHDTGRKALKILVTGALFATAGAWGHIAMAKAADSAVEPRLQLNKKFRAAIAPARAALAARDSAGLRAAIAAAKPHVHTADEQYVLSKVELSLAQMTSDRTATMMAVEQLVSSGEVSKQLTEAEKASLYALQGEFAYQRADHTKAERAFNAAVAAGNRDPQIAIFLADSQFRTGKVADAVRTALVAVGLTRAAGQKAPADWYARATEMAARARLSAEFVAISSAWLADYPDRETWYVALAAYRQMNSLASDADRDVLRLARVAASPGMFSLKDYVDYADRVAPVSLNDAVTLLREGISAGKISQGESPAISKLLTKVDPKLAAEKKKLAGKPGGTSYAALSAQADGLYGIREFGKAAELYRQALAASGADAGQGNVRLAAALAQANDKAGALAALDKVTTGTYAPIAAYWRAWIEHPATS